MAEGATEQEWTHEEETKQIRAASSRITIGSVVNVAAASISILVVPVIAGALWRDIGTVVANDSSQEIRITKNRENAIRNEERIGSVRSDQDRIEEEMRSMRKELVTKIDQLSAKMDTYFKLRMRTDP